MKSRFLYLTVFISGAIVLIIEILGTRALAPFYGSTIFVWSSLISVTLGFLAIGYWFGGKMADKTPSFFRFYSIIFLGGTFVLALYQFKRFIILFADNFGLQYGPLVASILLFGITFFLLGMITPFAIRLRTHLLEKVGTRTGSIFAFSTLGSLVGALAAGFVLVPLFGLNTIFLSTSITLILLSIIGVWIYDEWNKVISLKTGVVLMVIVAVFGVGYALKAANIPEMTFKKNSVFKREILYESNNFYGNNKLVGVPRASDGKWCFLIDGTVQGCVVPGKEGGHAYSPVAVLADTLPNDANFLMLGLGIGEYFYYYDTSRFKAQAVDINPATFAVARITGSGPEDKGYSPHIDDARSFLRKTNQKYDLIFTDLLSNVTFPDYVFTRESFELVKQRLSKNGSFVFSVVGKTNGEDRVVNAMLATAEDVFPYVYIYSERPEAFFTYNLVVGRNTEIKENIVSGLRLARGSVGKVVTDEYNPLTNWWTNNLETNLAGAPDLRMKFKRLTKEDFYE